MSEVPLYRRDYPLLTHPASHRSGAGQVHTRRGLRVGEQATWSRRSARVDFPWSMCAMMLKFRILSAGTCSGQRNGGRSATPDHRAPHAKCALNEKPCLRDWEEGECLVVVVRHRPGCHALLT